MSWLPFLRLFIFQGVQSHNALTLPTRPEHGALRSYQRISISLILGDLCFKAKAELQSWIFGGSSLFAFYPSLSRLSKMGLILALPRLLVNQLDIMGLKNMQLIIYYWKYCAEEWSYWLTNMHCVNRNNNQKKTQRGKRTMPGWAFVLSIFFVSKNVTWDCDWNL